MTGGVGQCSSLLLITSSLSLSEIIIIPLILLPLPSKRPLRRRLPTKNLTSFRAIPLRGSGKGGSRRRLAAEGGAFFTLSRNFSSFGIREYRHGGELFGLYWVSL